jgi:hypothetical protein
MREPLRKPSLDTPGGNHDQFLSERVALRHGE